MINRWIELLKQSGKNTKLQVIKEMEEYIKTRPAVLYVCDKQQCENGICDICHYTGNIKHAANFEEVCKGLYKERC